MEYLLRLQMTNEQIDEKIYGRLIGCEGFKEILEEVQVLKAKKNQCRRIMNMCSEAQDDTVLCLQKINSDIIDEGLRFKEFNMTLNKVKDLDNNKPEAFQLLYQFKLEDISVQNEYIKEVRDYHKSGRNDPSRIADLEKMKKKTQSRKRYMEKYRMRN